jgi:hypothetical protein
MTSPSLLEITAPSIALYYPKILPTKKPAEPILFIGRLGTKF